MNSAAFSCLVGGGAARSLQHIIEYASTESAAKEGMGVENARRMVMMCLLMETCVKWIAERVPAKKIPTAEKRSEQIKGVHGMEAEVAGIDVRGGGRTVSGAASSQALLPISVVHFPLVLVTEDFVGLPHLLEPIFCLHLLVLVRMELQRHFPASLLISSSVAPFWMPRML
jgi:hypothetical protein